MTRALAITGTRPPRAFRTSAAVSFNNKFDHAISVAAQLDRLADIELAHGHGKAAERLAHQAAALREGAR